jgi:isoleucyl-tRNA synthetase
MQKAQQISSLVLSLRKKEMIKVRQPLQRIMIPVLDEQTREEIAAVADLIKAEVNVKEIEFLDDTSGILVKSIKPNFKVLGPRFGKEMKFAVQAIQKLTPENIKEIEQKGKINLEINGESTEISLAEVEITSEDIEGWLVASSGGITVALDVTLNETLVHEGIARELVNRIQNIRKDSGFEVTDQVKITLKENDKLKAAVEDNLNYIMEETLTASLIFSNNLKNGTVIEFDDMSTVLQMEKK